MLCSFLIDTFYLSFSFSFPSRPLLLSKSLPSLYLDSPSIPFISSYIILSMLFSSLPFPFVLSFLIPFLSPSFSILSSYPIIPFLHGSLMWFHLVVVVGVLVFTLSDLNCKRQ